MTLAVIQIILSVTLIVLILLQERQAGLSGVFGGEGSGFYQTRRGLEKIFFYGTIILAVIFVSLAIYQFVR